MLQDSYRECADDCERAAEELARLRDENAKLQGFVRAVLESDVAGGHLQTLAVRNGILIAETRTAPCGEFCSCVGVEEFPLTCYRLAEFVRAK